MPTYRELLLEAMKERKCKESQLNYVAKDFEESVIYELKALDSKIKALKKRVEVEDHEKAISMEKQKQNGNSNIPSFILSFFDRYN